MKKALIAVIFMGMVCSFVFSAESTEAKELSLKDVIYYALQNNLDLQVQKAQTESSRLSWRINKTIYLPTFQGQTRYQKSRQPSNSAYDGVDNVEGESFSWSSGIVQNLPLGGTLNFGFSNSRGEYNRLDYEVNPVIYTTGEITLTQPLLRGFGTLARNYQIYIAAKDHKISQYQLEQAIVTLVYNVESAYWELVYAHQNLEAAKMALQRAKDFLDQNQIKVKVGTIAPIEVLNSKAAVARNESQVIQAEQVIQTRDEDLKRILNMSKESFQIIPTDKPEVKTVEANFDSFLSEALENRPEMKRALLNVERENITIKYRKNQLLPSLQFVGALTSYGQAGTTWSISRLDPSDPDYKREVLHINTFKDAVKDLLNLKNNVYSFQLDLEIPIPLTRERLELAQAKIARDTALMQFKSTENTVFSEVKGVIKQLESYKKLVEADKIALELEGENLKAEEKKLSVGLSTNFNVLQYQESYASAQTQLLRSTINYVLTLARINQVLNRTLKEYAIKFK